jgi:ribosomal protein S18 acetylase RimI-like enzyme
MTSAPKPLRERVLAPTHLDLPRHPEIAVWRPSTEADIDEIWQLDRAMGELDHPNYLATREEIAEDYGFSHFHPELDSLVGVDLTGRIVASGVCMFPPGQETLVRSILFGGVHPSYRGRGIGRQLLEWQIARAEQQLASSVKTVPGWILVHADERAPQSSRLFERAGMRLARYFVALERSLGEPIRAIRLPAEIRIEQYRPELSGAVHAARNDAFMDHWGSQPASDEMWNSFVGSEVFAPELSFVALAEDPGGDIAVVGFVLSSVNEDDWANQGFTGSYIDLVGVRKNWRGRRIAQALLAAQFHAGIKNGHERTTLDVDADSSTGALGLYTGMGFRPTQRQRAYLLEF